MIIVNSKEYPWLENETISKLLKRMNYTFPMIVVKVNGGLVKKHDFSDHIIEDGDNIQVIHLISGG